jgi:hypothetical protein
MAFKVTRSGHGWSKSFPDFSNFRSNDFCLNKLEFWWFRQIWLNKVNFLMYFWGWRCSWILVLDFDLYRLLNLPSNFFFFSAQNSRTSPHQLESFIRKLYHSKKTLEETHFISKKASKFPNSFFFPAIFLVGDSIKIFIKRLAEWTSLQITNTQIYSKRTSSKN